MSKIVDLSMHCTRCNTMLVLTDEIENAVDTVHAKTIQLKLRENDMQVFMLQHFAGCKLIRVEIS